MSGGRHRLFVAVDPDEPTRRRLARVLDALKKAASDARWKASFTDPDRAHLTLKFLGNVDSRRVPDLAAGLAGVAIDPFEIAFEGLGSFPSGSRPRILWVGVTRGAAALKSLAEQVDRCCADLGFAPEEREFKPHLTLARLKWAPGSARSVLENVSPREAGSSPVHEMTLYRSELGPGGSRYTPLVRIPLGTGSV